MRADILAALIRAQELGIIPDQGCQIDISGTGSYGGSRGGPEGGERAGLALARGDPGVDDTAGVGSGERRRADAEVHTRGGA